VFSRRVVESSRRVRGTGASGSRVQARTAALREAPWSVSRHTWSTCSMQRVSSLAPGSRLASGTLCQAVNRGGAAPAGSRGRCDENSPHCYGGRQEEKPHRRATKFVDGRGDEFRQRTVRPSLGGRSDEDRQASGYLASVVKEKGRCVLVRVPARNGFTPQVRHTPSRNRSRLAHQQLIRERPSTFAAKTSQAIPHLR
jgi:hypothetical protein